MKQLKFRTKLAVALLASSALFGTAVLAASTAPGNAKAPANQGQTPATQGFTLKISDHAATALQGISAARTALMQWSGDQATTILKQVKTTLGNAGGGLDKATLIKDTNANTASRKTLTDSLYYPVGITSDMVTGFTLPQADTIPVPQKSALKSGTASETTDQVKAEQKVAANPAQQASPRETVYTTVYVALLPRDATMHAIDTAIAQVKKGDFAAADLALNSINGSIVFGSMTQHASQPVTG